MKSPKKTPPQRIPTKTPKTDNLVYKMQSEQLPFSQAFYKLLELARAMERELFRHKNLNKTLKKNKPQLELGRLR